MPIDDLLPDLQRQLAEHARLVLEAPPGAGKTTRVPLALLDADWRGAGRIIMLEPRRVAARAAAQFMADSLGQSVGETVGYRIRFESRVSADTQLEVVTEGILTRMIQDDPSLDGVAAVLFDEFHERHLSADLGLALTLDVQAQLRPELRVLVMSATLDGERLAALLDAPRLQSQGRAFPVTIEHYASRREESLEQQVKRCVEMALARQEGDLLVFLPGQREINRCADVLAGVAAPTELEVLPLHGELPVERQAEVLRPAASGRRRVVLATNVAESSVTLPGVRMVIDSGLAREPRFDPNSGFSRLATVAISQASADQRAGRAGRLGPGYCYRLWPESQRLEPQRRAEIAQVDLAGLALELAAWGSAELLFPDQPPSGALAAGRDLLRQLGALQDNALTDLGRRMLRLGTEPRLAAMLLAAPAADCALACDLAALLEARDPLRGGASRRDDLYARWQALSAFRTGRADAAASRSALAAIDRSAQQWRRRLRINQAPTADAAASRLGLLLSHAFPDRIARQHAQDPLRYQLANGRSARLFDDSALYGEPWIVISELRYAEREGHILRGLPLSEADLRQQFPSRFGSQDVVRWDAAKRAIVALRELRFERIVLEQKPLPNPDPSRYAEALVDAVRQLGLAALPWTEALSQWLERARCIGEWREEADWPDFSDSGLLDSVEDWLQPGLAGKSRLSALSEQELAHSLRSRLSWQQQQRLEQLAPVRLEVPSGQQRPIHYEHGKPPVLAVKLQEMFGLADTPRIADGRVPLTLHLLSPAGRPLQVTQDLRGFWERTYPEVKKEMKGRYPKHPWPDDPWSAVPTHRAKPRSR
ncbi:ATP-dependent helicase HrpB [Pseudoxanthomonas sp. CAU 1598]|uniref:ATP-dependent helicase HrpB n=1 Tax=Pseudomarimonas arenosa TaxID=2774145 RepID=A0AAW3ZP67_9GAMM|nr:ATP-dependent helicase HrpB [Pseudomarimonas arenosa]MBD8527955.1 ATP-dependent helicase HrpB [Pseudomarimonas arenosa]